MKLDDARYRPLSTTDTPTQRQRKMMTLNEKTYQMTPVACSKVFSDYQVKPISLSR